MIDTDKYEGHTLNNLEIDADLPTWGVYDGNGKVVADYNPTDDVDINEANARLIADAPLLLEEVKRLRDILGCIKGIEMDWGIDFNHASITVTHFTGLMLSGELKLEMMD